jgi:hypothetical protein
MAWSGHRRVATPSGRSQIEWPREKKWHREKTREKNCVGPFTQRSRSCHGWFGGTVHDQRAADSVQPAPRGELHQRLVPPPGEPGESGAGVRDRHRVKRGDERVGLRVDVVDRDTRWVRIGGMGHSIGNSIEICPRPARHRRGDGTRNRHAVCGVGARVGELDPPLRRSVHPLRGSASNTNRVTVLRSE